MDERLEQLIQAACQHPTGSQEWRRAMHRLLLALQQLPGLRKSSHPDYLQALNQTWNWITRNICRDFEPRSGSIEQSLVRWINGYLYWRIRDLYLTEDTNVTSLDKSIGDEEMAALVDRLSETNLKSPSLSGLEGYIEQLQRQEIQRVALDIEQYIQQDPEEKLRNCYPSSYPNCDCHLLCRRRLLKQPPDTFQGMAQELNMPFRQLTNHWYGRCKPLLKNIAQSLTSDLEDYE